MLRKIYVGGLPDEISESNLSERFGNFGKINSIEIARSALEPHNCRGFAHINIEIDSHSWDRLRSTFNGSLWKGKKIRIEEALPDYKSKLLLEKEVPHQESRTKKHPLCRHARNMSVITEDNLNERMAKGWIRGKYGRPVAVLRMRKPTGKIETVDSAHYKESYQRFHFGNKSISVSKINWSINDEKLNGETDACTRNLSEIGSSDSNREIGNSDLNREIEVHNNVNATNCNAELTNDVKIFCKEKVTLRDIFGTSQTKSEPFRLFSYEAEEEKHVEIPAEKQYQAKNFTFKNIPFIIKDWNRNLLFVRSNSDEVMHTNWVENKNGLYEKIAKLHRSSKRLAQKKFKSIRQ